MNPSFVPAALALLLPALLAASPAAACDRVATVANVRPGGGPVMIAVFVDEAGFRKTPAARFRVEPTATQVRQPLCEVRADWLALAVFQDTNGNGQTDTNLLGLPTEPWGASGTASAFGPPTWMGSRVPGGTADVRVELSK